MGSDKLLYVATAADRLRCSRTMIYKLLDLKELSGVRIGSHYRVWESSLDIYLKNNKVKERE